MLGDSTPPSRLNISLSAAVIPPFIITLDPLSVKFSSFILGNLSLGSSSTVRSPLTALEFVCTPSARAIMELYPPILVFTVFAVTAGSVFASVPTVTLPPLTAR